jgi:hypothetical protein
MIWLLLIPCVGLLIWGICLKRGGKKIARNPYVPPYPREYEYRNSGYFPRTLGLAGIMLIIFCLPYLTITNSSTVAQLQAFYDNNAKNYSITVDRTAAYLSSDNFSKSTIIEGSVEKFQQAGYISDRIKEWRDAINWYNLNLASLKYYDSNIFIGILIPDAVQDMKFIEIK